MCGYLSVFCNHVGFNTNISMLYKHLNISLVHIAMHCKAVCNIISYSLTTVLIMVPLQFVVSRWLFTMLLWILHVLYYLGRAAKSLRTQAPNLNVKSDRLAQW